MAKFVQGEKGSPQACSPIWRATLLGQAQSWIGVAMTDYERAMRGHARYENNLFLYAATWQIILAQQMKFYDITVQMG